MGARVRGGGSAGSGSTGMALVIPSNARKVVLELKEIVKNSEDEIYSMLKECDMDPNEAVQRLLSQDTFHEVRRKRDKKRENDSKEAGDGRSRTSEFAPSARGGRLPARGAGRGNYAPRANTSSAFGGGRALMGRGNNGSYQNSRSLGNPVSSPHIEAQAKPVFSSGSREDLSGAFSGGRIEANNVYSQSAVPEPHSSWGGPGYRTMADIVKSKAAPQPPAPMPSLSAPYADSAANFVDRTVKRDNDWVGDDQTTSGSFPLQLEFSDPAIDEPLDLTSSGDLHLKSAEDETLDIGMATLQESHSSHLPSNSGVGGVGDYVDLPSEEHSLPQDTLENLEARGTPPPAMYQSQQQTIGFQKGHSVVTNQSSVAALSSPPPQVDENEALLSAATSKLRQLHFMDDQPVIIPRHLQVPEAERPHLSFGSFGEDFDSLASTAFVSESNGRDFSPDEASLLEEEESIAGEAGDQPLDSSPASEEDVAMDRSFPHHQTQATGMPPLNSSAEATTTSEPTSPEPQQEPSNSERVIQQNPEFPYLQTAVPSYQGGGLGLVPQNPHQYPYEAAEAQPSEPSRLQNFAPPSYPDPHSFLSPVLRTNSDVDVRYPQILSTNASSKYGAGISLMSGQSLSTSQQGGSSVVLPTGAGLTGQAASQTAVGGGPAQTTMAMPQQMLPIQAYPAQPGNVAFSPFGTNVFGYQLVPQSFAFLPTYPHGYTGNTPGGYPQLPSGSSYAPGVGTGYPPSGVKYAFAPYKPSAGANGPHVAVAGGYGNYSTTPSAGGTAGTASGYEDVVGSQFKESSPYIANQQQSEGSTLWLSRDMGAMQGNNSYYNLAGQGQQHTGVGVGVGVGGVGVGGYTHSQPPPTHAHPSSAAAAYGSLYHLPHSAATVPTTAHHLLQQQAQASAVTQGGTYQPSQRGQHNWTNGY